MTTADSSGTVTCLCGFVNVLGQTACARCGRPLPKGLFLRDNPVPAVDLPRPLLTITVYGQPAPMGSKTRTRFGMRESSANVAPWREAVKQAALVAQETADRVRTPTLAQFCGECGHPLRDHQGVEGMCVTQETTCSCYGWRPSTFWGLNEPLRLDVTFYLPPPKKRRPWPTTRPDLSKLIRSTEDALTDAGVWVDDSRVVEVRAVKTYAGVRPPGAYIVIYSHGGAT